VNCSKSEGEAEEEGKTTKPSYSIEKGSKIEKLNVVRFNFKDKNDVKSRIGLSRKVFRKVHLHFGSIESSDARNG
jgi:hypothetical protein